MKTAVFLGAGASRADDAPLQFEIIPKFFELCKNKEFTERYPIIPTVQNDLALYFKTFYSIDVNDQSEIYPSFEEVLGILDIAELKYESFKRMDENWVQKQKFNMIVLLATVLDYTLRESSETYHRKLLSKLKKTNELSNIIFISTNYDILIDNAILFVQDYKQNIDYGNIDFRNYYHADANNSLIKPDEQSIKLYKLHGSLNWVFCPICNSIKLTPQEKGIIRTFFEKTENYCTQCGSKPIPIIIPPTFFKNMGNVNLASVWNQAEIAMHDVDNVIFCGYSFPDADMHIKYLMKRTQIFRDNKIHFTVINHHLHKKKQQKDEERERYNRILGKEFINYTNCSFQLFCKNPRKILKDLIHCT